MGGWGRVSVWPKLTQPGRRGRWWGLCGDPAFVRARVRTRVLCARVYVVVSIGLRTFLGHRTRTSTLLARGTQQDDLLKAESLVLVGFYV